MIARLRSALSRQLSNPTGRAGRLVAAAMNRGNRDFNTRAIAALDVRDGARVLDLGFGGGLTFPLLLERGATVVGVDRAEDMVAAARERYAGDARVAVHTGAVEQLPLEDASVDRVLTVNTVYFWPDLAAAFGELRRVLAPGGRIVVGIRDFAAMQNLDPDVFTLRPPEEVAAALTAAGFAGAAVDTAADGKTHLVTATRA